MPTRSPDVFSFDDDAALSGPVARGEVGQWHPDTGGHPRRRRERIADVCNAHIRVFGWSILETAIQGSMRWPADGSALVAAMVAMGDQPFRLQTLPPCWRRAGESRSTLPIDGRPTVDRRPTLRVMMALQGASMLTVWRAKRGHTEW